jgi:large subunit ribosomal protein L16
MPLLPARVKHRKQHTRGHRLDHVATAGNTLAFGDYGIQVLESGELSARALEAARVSAAHYLGKAGKMWCRVFPHTPVGKHPAETRMGTGKGEVNYWAAFVDAGTVIYELGGVTEEQAREALRRQSFKMPLRTRLVKRTGKAG